MSLLPEKLESLRHVVKCVRRTGPTQPSFQRTARDAGRSCSSCERAVPHQVGKRARCITAERTKARGPLAALKQPHVTDNRAQEDVSVTRTEGKEASNLLEVNSMESLKEVALTMSRKHLLSFMPLPDSIAMQPFQEASSAPSMPQCVKVSAQQGLITQVNLRMCMSALLTCKKLMSPLPRARLSPMMLLHPTAEEPTSGPSSKLPLNATALQHVACSTSQAASPHQVEVRRGSVQNHP